MFNLTSLLKPRAGQGQLKSSDFKRSRFWSRRWFQWVLLWLVAIFSLTLAYQAQPHSFRLEVGTGGDSPYLAQFYQEESNPDFNYRWSRSESYVNLPYSGSPYQLTFRAVTNRPDGQPLDLTIIANGKELGKIKISGPPQIYTIQSNNLIWGSEELALTFRSANTFAEPGGRTNLGFALDWIEVKAFPNRAGLIIPPPFILGWWLLVVSFGAFLAKRWRFLFFFPALALVCLFYLLPDTSRYLQSNWLTAGMQIGLLQLVVLIGLALWQRRVFFTKKPAISSPPKKTESVLIAEERPLLNRRKRWWINPALLLFLGLSLFYLATARGRMGYGDDVTMEAVSANIAAGKPAAPLNAFFSDVPANPPLHSKYGLGQSLVATPFYMAGDKAAKALPFMLADRVGERGLITYIVLLCGLLEVAGTAFALYWVVRLLGYVPGIAFTTGALFGLTTMAWHYARTFFSENLVMLCLTLALGAALAYNQMKELRWAVMGGFVLGLAIVARSFNLALVPVFGLYLLFVWWRDGRNFLQGLKLALAWGLPILGWLIVIGWWNWARFGTPLETGYGGEAASFSTPLLKGLYGELFSPGKSLFLYNLVLILALAGLPALWRRRYGRGVLHLVGATVLIYLVVYGAWYEWYGGGVWGPRFLVPLLPLLCLPLASLLQVLRNPWFTRREQIAGKAILLLGFLTIVLSFAIQLLAVIVNYQIYTAVYTKDENLFQQMVFDPASSPILKHFELWQQNERPDFAPRFYHDTPFARFTDTTQSAAWLLFWLLLTLALLILIRKGNLNRRAAISLPAQAKAEGTQRTL